MSDQLDAVILVARRELRDQLHDWRIIFPLIILTLFFPFLMIYTARQAVDFLAQYGANLIGERIVPFLLMVVGFFPTTVSLVIALEAFVGEKERGTIEPLLSSPLKDWQLFMGKLLAATTAPVLTSYFGIAVYLVGLYFQHIPLPEFGLLFQTIALTTVQAVLMVSAAILISIQSTTVRGANLLSSFIVIPMALLIQGESLLMFWGNNQVLFLAVLGIAVMAGLLVRVGLAHFQRESLLGREIDVLNLRWVWKTFRRAFGGESRFIRDWYRFEVPKTLRKISSSLVLTVVLGLLGTVIGFVWMSANFSTLKISVPPGEVNKALEGILGGSLSGIKLTFPFILGHNLQAIAVIAFFGIFSFGVLGMLAYLGNLGVIGAVLALMQGLGYPPLLIGLAGILPHGIFEIPAMILSCAAVLHVGVVLVTPRPQRSLGEVFLEALADWLKIVLGLTLPLLVVAAAVETYLTPYFLLAFVK